MPSRRFACPILCVLALAVIFAASSQSLPQTRDKTQSTKPDLVVSGEVTSGNSFAREIGGGLIFRLVPTPGTLGDGWDIEVVPKNGPADGYAEYSAIVTPPYHFYNPRYLDASYGITAREAVGISPRAFQFVESPADSQAAYEVVNSVVYAADWEAHKDSLAAAAAKISLGTGELKILDSRITPGKNNEDLGSIDWIKFEVVLRLHSGVTLDKILFPDYLPKK